MKGPFFRRLTAVVLILMMVVSFAACGKAGSDASQTTAPASQEETTQAAATAAATEAAIDPMAKYDPVIKLKTVAALDATMKFDEGDDITNNVWTRTYRDELGIELEYIWTVDSSQYNQKISLAIASNDLPDLFSCDQQQFKMLYDNDLIWDLTDSYEKYGTADLKDVLTQDPIGFQSTKINGKIMGLPYTDNSAGQALLAWVRTDWLAKLGLQEPKTMQDLLAISEAFTTKDPDGNGKNDTFGFSFNKYFWLFTGFFNAYHAYPKAWIKDASGNVAFGSIQPEMKEALRALQDLYKKGQLNKEFGVKDPNNAAEDVINGKCGILYGLWWEPFATLGGARAKDANADWKAFAPFSIDDKPGLAQYSNIVGSYHVINKNFKYPEAAVKMYNFWVNILKHPTMENAGKYIVNLNNPEIVYYKYAAIIGWEPMGNVKKLELVEQALNSKDPSNLPFDALEEYKGIEKFLGDKTYTAGWGSYAAIGPNGSMYAVKKVMENQGLYNLFYGEATPVMAEKMPALDKMHDEVIVNIILGDSLDKFDKFVEDWKKLGGDEITKEVNDWYASHSN